MEAASPQRSKGLKKRRHKAPRALWAMRQAIKSPDKEGGPSDVMAWRRVFREKPDVFMRQLGQLEGAYQAAKGKVLSAGASSGLGDLPVEKMDEGTARVLELLRELRGEQG